MTLISSYFADYMLHQSQGSIYSKSNKYMYYLLCF